MQWKLIITFERLSEPSFNVKAYGIVNALITEPLLTLIPEPWPAVYPSRVDLVLALDEYQRAKHPAQDGSRSAISARNQKRLILTNLFKAIAPYLERVATEANDESILELTFFDRRRQIVRSNGTGTVDAPILKLKHGGLSGVLVARTNRVAGAGGYEPQFCAGDPGVAANWQGGLISTRCSRIELTGLTPGQLYFVRVRAIGGTGPGPWSNTCNLRAL